MRQMRRGTRLIEREGNRNLKTRIETLYKEKVIDGLIQRFGYKNPMQVPKMTKIAVNMGVGDANSDIKVLDSLVEDMATITGQRPVVTRAKLSVANFKVREGMPVGAKVTLRRHKMYEFFDRLVNIAFPRIRDFRGISGKQFDGRGNFALGLTEQLIFPEIDYDKIARVQGMHVAVVTSAGTDEEARELLRLLGVPFRTS
jgi:large subunit ribosomal protein L5